jgi:hypothetical protein
MDVPKDSLDLLVERLQRLGLSEAAQIVSRYEKLAAELHAANQKNIELKKTIDRLERKARSESTP